MGQLFSIVDIETTGGSNGNLITEIAICKTDGTQVIDRYESLINPHDPIPHSITLLTGISNEMVAAAPSFEELAMEIKAFLEGTVFVAHNVSFDYSIIKNHFDEIDVPFNMKKLCTVRLSRGIIQGLPSYSLGKLCKSLAIENENRHRAMGDAMATSKLFHLLVERDSENFIGHSLNQLNRETIMPPNLDKAEYDRLPENPGVYYLLGKDLDILYVGKAKNIKQRVTSHFTEKTRKKSELLRRIHHLGFEETGNELVAFLLESAEIKKHYPYYNKAQKSKQEPYYVSYYSGQDGVLRLDVFNKKYGGTTIESFTSTVLARDFLYKVVKNNGLCPKFCGLERTKTICYLGDECDICSGLIDADTYNQRVKDLLKTQKYADLLILGKGRAKDEVSAVHLKEGEYQGFGFVSQDLLNSPELIVEQIIPYKNNSDTKRILKQFFNGRIPRQYTLLEI